ncbi:Mpo1-like protein [uncultured Abyssibacter sp.]|uniref:Mpo1 family 2-hydroxy fatty acid dioxygenase n=1 Tax=uncultured Abyssibacter sp. TaxID=2320202 RepID=UPI0032B14F96
MRTRQELLQAYQRDHQNPTNQLIHMICVPFIVFSTLGLLWCIPVGGWLGLDPSIAEFVNVATIGAPFAGAFYLKLSLRSAVVMTGWYALSVLGILALGGSGWLLAGVSAAIWITAWAIQFYGHEVEGAKPSFGEDVVFLLIGPLFVMEKVYRRLGMRTTPLRSPAH